MNTKMTTIIVSLIILASIIIGAFVYDKLPDPMASHWNVNDEVDGYMSRFWGVFMMPLVTFGMFLFFLAIPRLDPLKANIAEFRETFNLFILMIVLFLGYLWKLSIFWNLGFRFFRMSAALLPALGLLFFMIGYMLRKAKRNWFIGIRTPWTLSSDTVWAEVHRLGATLFMVSGGLALLGVFFNTYAIWFTLVPVLGSTLFLYVYSFVLYQREINVE
ncbi:MAG: DUF1648 domain-containing protein [Anaerolineales bacterium]|nr:DUF1648 domain-containing protein [Anaerolineales bacterium]